MPRRYHRAQEFRREHAYVLIFLPACTLVTCVSMALTDVYRVRIWTRACLYSALVRYSRGISFACKFAKNACSWLCARDTCNFKREYNAREHQV